MSAEQQQELKMIEADWRPTRAQMVDSMNRPLTQSLFLEVGYNEDAVYTFKDDDHEYNGKTYPSLKRLYLQCADPTEYEFAHLYLVNWNHWLRMCENKLLRKHIDTWRAELEIKLRCEAIRGLTAQSRAGNLQAQKWLADRGWATRGAGRPPKEEVERQKAIDAAIADDFQSDIVRLKAIK